MKNNPFSIVFGKEPQMYVKNSNQFDEIRNSFISENPFTTTYLITGVRGSGKTVLLTKLLKYFENLDDWIVVELNPETDMLEYLASSIYEKSNNKYKYLKKEFSFSFQGISISFAGDKPVSNVITLIEKMIDTLKKKNKKILICIDDVSNNQNIRTFVQQYQIFIRKDYPLFLLMTGLFENVRNLQNEKSLTFLYRAPNINIGSLSLINIADSFEETLKIDREEAVKMSKLTKGYAFAYQVLGYVMYASKKEKLDEIVIKEFDKYLRDYVYEKVYFDLPEIEKKIVNTLAYLEDGKIAIVMEKLSLDKENISQYRDRLLKKGILIKTGWGKLDFALPRFREYVKLQKEFD